MALTLVQFLTGLLFVLVGTAKLTQPKQKLAAQMQWVEDFSQQQIRAIGSLEVLGAIGVVLPQRLDILPFLTPLAAVGLMLVMVGAAFTHYRRKEYPMLGINAALFALAAIVAVSYGL